MIIDKIFSYIKEVVQEFFALKSLEIANDYRSRIRRSFGLDPFICPECRGELILDVLTPEGISGLAS